MGGLGIISIGLLFLLSIPIVSTDLKQRRIPNIWNLALAVVGLAMDLVRSPHLQTLGVAALDCGATVALFAGVMLLMHVLKRPAGLGIGDVKFLAAASLWVGFGGAAILFILASLLTVITALAVAPWKGLDLKSHRPFGPMLAASLLAVMLFVELTRRNA
jgi:leader peptidase (prepilin peptidase)/N-methyltransferase